MPGWLPGRMVGSIIVEHLGSQIKESGDNFVFEYENDMSKTITWEYHPCDTALGRLEKGKFEAIEVVMKLFYILPMDQLKYISRKMAA